MQVWARQSGSTATYDSWTQTTYLLNAATGAPCTSVALAPSPASPQAVGTAVSWTATASGCTSPQYKYWTQAPTGGAWQVARDWGAATFAWTTTALATGTWYVQVWARQSGSTATYDSWTQTTYLLNAATGAPCTSVALEIGRASARAAGA